MAKVPGGVNAVNAAVSDAIVSLRGVRNLLQHGRAHAVSGGIYEQYEKLRSLGHMGHVREYTVTETVDFLQQVGFDIDALVFRGGHGQGIVGLAERLAPSFRPFFSVIARRTPSEAGES